MVKGGKQWAWPIILIDLANRDGISPSPRRYPISLKSAKAALSG